MPEARRPDARAGTTHLARVGVGGSIHQGQLHLCRAGQGYWRPMARLNRAGRCRHLHRSTRRPPLPSGAIGNGVVYAAVRRRQRRLLSPGLAGWLAGREGLVRRRTRGEVTVGDLQGSRRSHHGGRARGCSLGGCALGAPPPDPPQCCADRAQVGRAAGAGRACVAGEVDLRSSQREREGGGESQRARAMGCVSQWARRRSDFPLPVPGRPAESQQPPPCSTAFGRGCSSGGLAL
jgi:hypothetical protein